MTGALIFALLLSLALNVLSLRWAFHEHAGRRQWQEEATVLAHTLRSLGNGEAERAGHSPLPWVLVGLVGAGFFFLLWWVANVTGL